MPRPSKPRKVKALPKNAGFCPKGQPECSHPIILNVEEYETIRLIDYVGLTQEECALSMGVGRATVQSLYVEARKKLARFVVEASGLLIEGGNYEICSEKITGTKIKKEKSKEEKNESCTGSCNFIFSAHKISLYLLYYVLSTAYCIVSDRILSRRLDREKEK